MIIVYKISDLSIVSISGFRGKTTDELKKSLVVEINKDESTLLILDDDLISKVWEMQDYNIQIALINDSGEIKLDESKLKKPNWILRKEMYETLTHKQDGLPLIDWFGSIITIDDANKIYLAYLVEGDQKVEQIQRLIIDAKIYIRQLYPD